MPPSPPRRRRHLHRRRRRRRLRRPGFKQVFDLLEKREREGEGEGDELELSLELKSRLQGLSIPASKYANKRRNARQDITRLRDEYVAYVAQHAAAQHIVSRHGAGSVQQPGGGDEADVLSKV